MKLTFRRDDERFVPPVVGRHHVMGCMLCDRDVVDVVVTGPGGPEARYQGVCPCGARSQVYTIAGKVSVAPVSGCRPVDFRDEGGVTLILTEEA